MAKHSVTKPTDVPERSVSLITKLFQSEHGSIATVCKWSLQELKDLPGRRADITGKRIKENTPKEHTITKMVWYVSMSQCAKMQIVP